MSNLPFASRSNQNQSREDYGETSGYNRWNNGREGHDANINLHSSDEDDLSETGDIGVGQQVYASYQKSGHKSSKEKNQLKMEQTDEFDDDDFVNLNSSLKPRQSSTYMWLRHPKVRENWKTVTGAMFLLVIGILFIICGIVLSAIPKHDGPKSIIFFVCGAVCLLPGGYHTVYIYRATKGWRGYTFESLPSFQ